MYFFIMIFILFLSYIISKKNPNLKKYLMIISSIICLIYITWRVTVIPINNGLTSFLLGLLLFSSELLGLIAFFNFQFLFYKNYKLEIKTLDEFDSNTIPFVDVLICTYNEPLNLLEKTIAACLNLNYPCNKFKIHICDDGRRDSLKILCESYGINYITRNDNIGAKAGNINNALKFLNGDLFAVLDADMIPKKEFLSKTVGYFSNDNLAFVQTPQVYYNQDMYQYNMSKRIPNEQDFFMRNIQEARAAHNAVLHVGTNAVFRRKHINEIGGYPTCSITEDMAVGMLLQAKGYDSILINEDLVLGLSVTTFTELVKQRDRWCRGNLQVLKNFNPLFTKGLSFSQKIVYYDGAIYWFSNIQKLVYILCPIISLLLNVLIINTSIENLLKFYIPFLLGQILIFNVLSGKTRSLKWSHYYDTAMAPHLTLSILKEIFGLKINFNVTSKEITHNKKHFQFNIVLPQICIIFFTIVSWIISTKLVIDNRMILGTYLINMVWSIYNFIGAITSLIVAYQKPIFRTSERIVISEDIKIILNSDSCVTKGTLIDISEKGLGIKLYYDKLFNIGDSALLTLNKIVFKCKVTRVHENFIGLTFTNATPEQMKTIMGIFVDNMQPYYKVNKN